MCEDDVNFFLLEVRIVFYIVKICNFKILYYWKLDYNSNFKVIDFLFFFLREKKEIYNNIIIEELLFVLF